MSEKQPIIQAAEKPYRFLCRAYKRHVVLYGGAGAAKSWQIAIYLILHKFLQEPGVGILCLRKTMPAVRKSCYRLIIHLLAKAEISYTENKSNLIITSTDTGAWFEFGGLDDPEKLKSLEGINYIWAEETTEIAAKDYLQLNIRCRAKNPYGFNRLFRSFNPVDPVTNKWLKKITDNPPDDTEVLKLLHTDNPFLSEIEREQIERLRTEDAEYDKIYRLGEWATPTFIIYTNWDNYSDSPEHYPLVYYGLDFGYTNPTALVKIQTDDTARDIYMREIVYQTKLTNTDLIERIKHSEITQEDVIVADAAEPDRIAEIRQAGYNIHPAKKGQGSVTEGIDRCKRKRIHVHESSASLIEELGGYKNKVDKDDNISEDPVPFRDHGMDAMRYAVKKLDTDLGIVLGVEFIIPENDDIEHGSEVLGSEEIYGDRDSEVELDEMLDNNDMWTEVT